MQCRYSLLCLGLVATTSLAAPAADAPAERPYSELPYTPSLDLAAMDRSVRACDDLYRYSCGGWQQRNPIPADMPRWSVYGKLYQDNQRYLWGLLERDADPAGERNVTQRLIGDYFAACMDTARIETAGLAPLRSDLERINGLKSKEALGSLLGQLMLHDNGARFFVGAAVEQDARESERVIAALYPGGLGLPDRDYYVNGDAKSVGARGRYREHILNMRRLAGDDAAEAEAIAAAVMRIETALAWASLNRVDRRDPYKVYHRTAPAKLPQIAPGIDWPALLAAAEITQQPWLNIAEPGQLKEVAAIIAREPLAELQRYLRWALLDQRAGQLNDALAAADFAFYSGYLRGVPKRPPRWQTCVDHVDDQLGEALGREFVERNFPPEVRGDVLRMTRQIQDAMRARIEALEWMSAETRAQALAKLATLRNKIGHPENWRDYGALTVSREDFYGNVVRATLFESRRQLAKIGKPVDREEWFMSPATVNAYYNPQLNDINFPAGVLMPPLYDPRLDDAPNYGNTGSTIGHELAHGFDDTGRQFDEKGNLRDWWTPEDAERFESKADCVRNQYSGYVAVDDIHVNGKLTAGEDIADLGGVIIAWMAWQEQAKLRAPVARDDLTPEQRFFVGFAQWVCSNERPEDQRVRAITDPHSPPGYRINGVVVNMPEFQQAFDCKPGDALYRESDRMCRVW